MHGNHVIRRRRPRRVVVSSVAVGGNVPISIQSMTNTHADEDLVDKIERLVRARIAEDKARARSSDA